jgi:hypothetical protein
MVSIDEACPLPAPNTGDAINRKAIAAHTTCPLDHLSTLNSPCRNALGIDHTRDFFAVKAVPMSRHFYRRADHQKMPAMGVNPRLASCLQHWRSIDVDYCCQ